nr:hypothetical protein GCM10020063_070840 [Dactylosporangium thailandense]
MSAAPPLDGAAPGGPGLDVSVVRRTATRRHRSRRSLRLRHEPAVPELDVPVVRSTAARRCPAVGAPSAPALTPDAYPFSALAFAHLSNFALCPILSISRF